MTIANPKSKMLLVREPGEAAVLAILERLGYAVRPDPDMAPNPIIGWGVLPWSTGYRKTGRKVYDYTSGTMVDEVEQMAGNLFVVLMPTSAAPANLLAAINWLRLPSGYHIDHFEEIY